MSTNPPMAVRMPSAISRSFLTGAPSAPAPACRTAAAGGRPGSAAGRRRRGGRRSAGPPGPTRPGEEAVQLVAEHVGPAVGGLDGVEGGLGVAGVAGRLGQGLGQGAAEQPAVDGLLDCQPCRLDRRGRRRGRRGRLRRVHPVGPHRSRAPGRGDEHGQRQRDGRQTPAAPVGQPGGPPVGCRVAHGFPAGRGTLARGSGPSRWPCRCWLANVRAYGSSRPALRQVWLAPGTRVKAVG